MVHKMQRLALSTNQLLPDKPAASVPSQESAADNKSPGEGMAIMTEWLIAV